jgi:crotonobetainyl-CoA:carnitine CoA-transferase CaiB-like acyl-CoA transferase
LEIVKELAMKSDVVVENFKRGTMDKLGLGYEQLKMVKPDIIYASLSGFGLNGPYKDRTSFAPIAEAMSSWMRLTGDNVDPNGPPLVPAEYHGDLDPGLYAAIAILGALRYRDRTGEGQLIDVSQLDVMIAQTGVSIIHYTLSGDLPWQARLKMVQSNAWGAYKTKDDKYVYVAADQNMSDRVQLATGIQDLGEGDEIFRHWAEGHTSQDIIDAMATASVPVSPVYQINEMLEDPHVKAREAIIEINHKTAGKIREPAHPVKYSRTPTSVRNPAPLLGEDNDEVLRSLLGYDQKKIDDLRSAGIIV